MNERFFEQFLLEAAEETSRKNSRSHIEILRKSYMFFKGLGISEESVKSMMALTSHQVYLITQDLHL